MSDQAHALAAQFRQMNAAVIRFAQECSPDDWRRMVPDEGRPVAYLIDHIAWGYGVERKAMLACLTGQAPPLAPDELAHTFTTEELHAMNAARWEANPYPDREATIARLRAEGEETARVIEQLSEQALAQPVRYGRLERTAAEFVARPLIAHPEMHLPGIRHELATASRD